MSLRNKHFCKVCKINISEFDILSHNQGKKHLNHIPKIINVKGTFGTDKVTEVNNYFSQFGNIHNFTVTAEEGKTVISYTFSDIKAHSVIIHKEHKIFDEVLEITWISLSNKPAKKLVKNVGRVLTEITPGASQEQKPELLEKPVEQNKKVGKMTANSEATKRAIIASVKEPPTFAEQVAVLQNQLQKNKTEIENNRKLIYNDLSMAFAPTNPQSKICFFGSSITGLDIQGSDLDIFIDNIRPQYKSEIIMLKIIRQLIFKCRKFCDVLLISGAKIPIIKCIHWRTQMCCDLNVKNKLSVRNSELIKYYLGLDEKIRPLMLLVKFWADLCDLKKVNFFSSYALYMMVIFYLQQEPYNLPSVLELQKNTPPDIVDGWNCAFVELEFTSPALKTASMLELVAGFFRFYGDFDYVNNAICPYFGSVIEKIAFLKPYDLSDCYHSYMSHNLILTANSGICIQDPFEHARNVSVSIPLQCVGKFTHLCRIAVQITEKGEKELLFKLLTNKTLQDYGFVITKTNGNDEEWINSVQNLTHKLLNDVLKLKVTQTRNGLMSITYNCVGEQNIWHNRINILKNLLTQLPSGTSEIDKEIATTECILKYFPQNVSTALCLNLTFKENPRRAEVLIRQLGKCKNFLHVYHFIKVKLIKFVNLMEKPKEVEVQPEVQVQPEVPADTIQAEEMTNKNDNISEEVSTCGSSSSKKEVNDPPEEIIEISNDSDSGPPEESVALVEEDEEDVPADFFDDFSNQDFMDGLDIVDAWDEGAKSGPPGTTVKEKSGRKHSPIRFTPTGRKSQERSKKYPPRTRSRSKSLTRRYRRRSRSRSREKIRRDPEKTKRDINRDKIKCAKDKEQKIVNDKLRIVETGLVPPGTEMDVDLGTILKEKQRFQVEGIVERPRERRLPPSTGEVDFGKEKRRSYTRNSIERARVRRLPPVEVDVGKEKRRSLERSREKRYKRSASRELRKPSRHSRSPPPYRSRIREREPLYRLRKRTSSMDSNLSERELWIRSSRKKSRSRSRSRDRDSPRLKLKRKEEIKKKTFLEEIREKLNEVRPVAPVAPVPIPYNMGFNNALPVPAPTPAPVPAPNPTQIQFFQPQPTPNVQYDQSFFIGASYQVMNQPQNVSFNPVGSTGNVVSVAQRQINQMQPIQQGAVQTPPPPALNQPKIENVSSSKREIDTGTKEDIDKLFADKKISLSDFLTITAKCEVQSSSPAHLQKKIKVISRCQDTIKVMTEDRKFSGRLSVKPSTEQKNKSEVKYQSPLRRIPVVRFQFTTPPKISEDVDGFSLALDKILRKVGLIKDITDLEESTENVSKSLNNSFADEEAVSLTQKASILGTKKTEVSCEECKKRKLMTFVEVGSQCADNKETCSIGVQVVEEELTPTKVVKNESIAYLTPAQLLGKDKEKEKEKEKVKEVEKEPEGLLEKVEKRKIEPPVRPPAKRGRAKLIPRGRGGFRKGPPSREQIVYDTEEFDFYNYDYEPEYERTRALAFDRFEEPSDYGHPRYGGPSRRFHYEEEIQPDYEFNHFRGRPRFAPRF